MFLPDPHSYAESGGGGNRTRVAFPPKPHDLADSGRVRLETALLIVFAIGYVGGALSILIADWLVR